MTTEQALREIKDLELRREIREAAQDGPEAVKRRARRLGLSSTGWAKINDVIKTLEK